MLTFKLSAGQLTCVLLLAWAEILIAFKFRYTYYALEFLENVKQDSKKTMGEFLEVCPKRQCISTVGKRTDLFRRDPYKVRRYKNFYLKLIMREKLIIDGRKFTSYYFALQILCFFLIGFAILYLENVALSSRDIFNSLSSLSFLWVPHKLL